MLSVWLQRHHNSHRSGLCGNWCYLFRDKDTTIPTEVVYVETGSICLDTKTPQFQQKWFMWRLVLSVWLQIHHNSNRSRLCGDWCYLFGDKDTTIPTEVVYVETGAICLATKAPRRRGCNKEILQRLQYHEY